MNAKAIRTTGLASVILLLASCASDPYYSNNAYHQGGYPNGGGYPSGNNIDYGKTAALVAAGVAGLSLYHYSKEKDKRRDAERALERRRGYNGGGNYYRGRDWNNNYDRRGRR